MYNTLSSPGICSDWADELLVSVETPIRALKILVNLPADGMLAVINTRPAQAWADRGVRWSNDTQLHMIMKIEVAGLMKSVNWIN